MTFYLALRNLLLLRKRYAMIGFAILIGFALITLQTGIAYGAMETVMIKAARYFSGHVSITGYLKKKAVIENPEKLVSEILSFKMPVRTVSPRTIYAGKEARLFFGGNSVRLRRQIGVDFEKEKDELSGLPFLEGGIEGMLGEGGTNGIIISRAAARLLGAKLGDDISFYLTTDDGQHNTATMVIRGIFDETSIFGYATYMNNRDLNRLLNRSSDAATEIAVYAKEGVNIPALTEKIRQELEKTRNVFPPIPGRSEFPSSRKRNTASETLAVMSLDAHLDQIKNLLDAFVLGTYFVFAVFMIIVMVGVLNTYRVLVYERTREIGTMRALGMQKKQVRLLFLLEAVFLAAAASVAGFFVGIIMLHLAGLPDLGMFLVSAFFTESGKLKFYLNPAIVLFNFSLMIISVMSAAWGPSGKAANITPAQAIAGKI